MISTDVTLPPTTTRVERNTAETINERIERETVANIERVAKRGPAAIAERLEELDREWDMERTLETNASSVVLLGVVLGFTVNRRWFLLPGIAAGFLLQHALQGWCPPIPIFRRRGVRTAREIEIEATALRILRGDFEGADRSAQDAFLQAKGEFTSTAAS